MSYQFVVMPDISDGWPVKDDQVLFASSKKDLAGVIRQLSGKNSQATITVYKLEEVHRLKTPPIYQKYFNKDGEIIPE